jgi:hypothetical protein
MVQRLGDHDAEDYRAPQFRKERRVASARKQVEVYSGAHLWLSRMHINATQGAPNP